MVNTHLSKPTECKTPSTKLALWSLMLTIDEATLTHLMDHSWGGVDQGGGCRCVEAGGSWECSVLSAQFCSEPRASLKIKSI